MVIGHSIETIAEAGGLLGVHGPIYRHDGEEPAGHANE
jgi:hypothetical protein